MKTLLLTFDIEEFEYPLELGLKVNEEELYEIGKEGTKRIIELVKKNNIKSTFFVTLRFAEKYPRLIKGILNLDCEIASQGYQHTHRYSKMNEKDAFNFIKKSKIGLEELFKIKINGFRAPQMQPPDYKTLKKIGFLYDSSLHPTYIPGYYNKFFSPRGIFENEGIKVLPISVTPLLHLPFSWIWFRNFGLSYAKLCTKLTLLDKNFVNIYFHPWDCVDLTRLSYVKRLKMMRLIVKNTGVKFINNLDAYIKWCLKNKFKTNTIINYLNRPNKNCL